MDNNVQVVEKNILNLNTFLSSKIQINKIRNYKKTFNNLICYVYAKLASMEIAPINNNDHE